MAKKKPERRHRLLTQFGALLRASREKKKLSQQSVVAKVIRANLALEGFSRGQLSNYENGVVDAPDPVVLYYLAKIYKEESVEEVIRVLASDRERRALEEQADESPPGRRSATS